MSDVESRSPYAIPVPFDERFFDKAIRIGLLGESGTGKSSIAQHLQERYGFQLVQLAAPIKRFVMDVLGVESKTLNYGPRHAAHRAMMQQVGTAMRSVDEDAFIRKLLRVVEDEGPLTNWVVPDVRFQNEATYLRKAGFLIVKLTKCVPAVSGKEWVSDWRLHESETEQATIKGDYAFYSYPGDLRGLLATIDSMMATLRSSAYRTGA